ncbi:hypothetical protein HZH68_012215 [Vespula germanica]|uniref:Uncharacterized protein n=1 Tax=Vespula germanica TaxID=30212 RepID=A0A834JGJ5_VESGE|nr:hypothetical protein HZH68_012215 [Vespula germanica]
MEEKRQRFGDDTGYEKPRSRVINDPDVGTFSRRLDAALLWQYRRCFSRQWDPIWKIFDRVLGPLLRELESFLGDGLFPFLFNRRNRRENHVDTIPLTNRDIDLREVKDKKEDSKKDSSNDVSVEQYSSGSTE